MPDELTLADVAGVLPGTGDIMAGVGACWGNCWHAGNGGNLDLAAYFVRRARSLLRKLVVVRPKYTEQVAEFDRDYVEPVYQALMNRDVPAFKAAYQRAVERADYYHVDTGHPYIRWRTPEQPPDPGLDFNPV